MDFNMIGPALALGLACVGSSIGCGIAGMAAHAVMSRVEENHGKFIGMSVMPASQSIYGVVLMILLRNKVLAGSVSPLSAVGIGVSVGLALIFSSVYQGMCAASGIQASAKKPSILGKSFVSLGIIESFALFAFIFALML